MLASEAGLHVGAGQGRSLRVLSSQLEIKAGEEAGLRFGMFRSCFPPGTGMPFLHLHRSYEEAFHVLAGEVQFQLGANEIYAQAQAARSSSRPASRTAFATAAPSRWNGS